MTTRREVEALEKLARAKVRSAEAEAKLFGVLAEALKAKGARNSDTDKPPTRSGGDHRAKESKS